MKLTEELITFLAEQYDSLKKGHTTSIEIPAKDTNIQELMLAVADTFSNFKIEKLYDNIQVTVFKV
jgi:hypothetical protein